jgi:hypothetical protein
MRGYAGNDAVQIPALIAGALGFGEGEWYYFTIEYPEKSCQTVGLVDSEEEAQRLREVELPVSPGSAGRAVPCPTAGYVDRIFYAKTPDQNSKLKYLAVYILDWTPSTQDDKTQLINDDDQEWIGALRLKGYTDVAKHDLMDDSLADAILYTGKRRTRIDYVFNMALSKIEEDSPGSTHRNVIISFSLGSVITLRGLSEISYPLGPEEKSFSSHVCKVYFLANQIPLLALGIDEDPSPTKHLYQSLGAETREKTSLCGSTGGPWVVSVSDPNDLLSYPIPEDILRKYPNTFADVGLSIADKAYWVPFTNYWVPNPVAAHTGYGSNKKVRELLLEGYKPKALLAGPC